MESYCARQVDFPIVVQIGIVNAVLFYGCGMYLTDKKMDWIYIAGANTYDAKLRDLRIRMLRSQ